MVDKKREPSVARFRLNVYGPNGTLRSNIKTEIYYDVIRRYGDIVRCISSNHWVTEDELCDAVWTMERKMKHPTGRTRKQILAALNELIEKEFLIVKW